MNRTVPVTAASLEVPGATLYYEVRGTGPVLLLVGAPMNADAFAPLAGLLAADHTVLTTDPRGITRSTVDDRDADSTPEMRADDLAALLRHLDRGPAAALGSSGGAITVLALAQAHPGLVHTAIAHEPPLDQLLPDRAELLAATDDMIASYLAGDVFGAWKQFMAVADIQMPDFVIERMFMTDRSPQTVADEHLQFAHMLRPGVSWIPDLDALRAGPVRIVAGIGEQSAGQLCDRAARALAAGLGVEPAMFPGGHIGFAEDPAAFEPRLRAVLGEG
jgi:pimeloyl-ACP methyl ester carboxylesterase